MATSFGRLRTAVNNINKSNEIQLEKNPWKCGFSGTDFFLRMGLKMENIYIYKQSGYIYIPLW